MPQIFVKKNSSLCCILQASLLEFFFKEKLSSSFIDVERTSTWSKIDTTTPDNEWISRNFEVEWPSWIRANGAKKKKRRKSQKFKNVPNTSKINFASWFRYDKNKTPSSSLFQNSFKKSHHEKNPLHKYSLEAITNSSHFR